MDNNYISEYGIYLLSFTLRSGECPILKELNIACIIYIFIDNNINDLGLEYLSDALHYSIFYLESINLSGCNISDNGLQVFCNSLITADHKTLQSIYISRIINNIIDNKITSMSYFFDIFKNKSCPNLYILDVSCIILFYIDNQLSCESFNSFLRVIIETDYKELKYLYFEGNNSIDDNTLLLFIDIIQAGCLNNMKYIGIESILFNIIIDTSITETGIIPVLPKFKDMSASNIETINTSGIKLSEKSFRLLTDVIRSGGLASLKHLNICSIIIIILIGCNLSKESISILSEGLISKQTPNLLSFHISCIL